MAIKRSVIEIDVNDAKFKRYVAAYQKYDGMLQKAPGLWEQVTDASSENLTIARMISAAMLAQADVLKRVEARQTTVTDKSRRMADYWAKVAASSRAVENHLKSTFTAVAKFTGISTIVGALGVGAGMWGLDRLALSANTGRRSSTGMGLTYGQQTAFGLSYNRLIDSSSFLGGISTARGNISSGAATALSILGISPTASGTTGDIANEALQRIRQKAKETPEEQLGILADSHKLGELGIGVEDLRRLKSMGDAEFGEFRGQYSRQAAQLQVAEKTLALWQKFDNELDSTTQKLKTGLLNGLVALTPQLAKLTSALGDTVQSLVESGTFKWAIDAVASGLKTFADYVSTNEFKEDIQTFVRTIGSIAKKLVAALKWLDNFTQPGMKPGDAATAFGSSPQGSATDAPPAAKDFWGSVWKGIKSGFGKSDNIDYSAPPADVSAGDAPAPYKRGGWGRSGRRGHRDVLGGAGMPTGSDEMEAYRRGISGIESGSGEGRYDALGPTTATGDRAYGRYQVMGANIPGWTKRALGRSMTAAEFLSDPAAQDKVFDFIFGEYVKKYGKEGAAKAWFAGEGGMNNNSASDSIPGVHRGLTVGQYGARFMAGLGATSPASIKIDVNNNTGGNATVSASAMGIIPQ